MSSVADTAGFSAGAWSRHGFEAGWEALVGEGTLVHGWLRCWRDLPDHPTLFDDHHGWVTASELQNRTAEIARRIARLGLRRGDRILMSCAPSVDLVIAHIAALRLGLVVVPVNVAFSAHEMANVIRESGAKLAVVDDTERVTSCPVVMASIEVSDVTQAGAIEAPELDALDGSDPAMLVFTSGTTGRPKGALLSHANLLSSAEALRIAWGWTSEDRLVLSLPLFHMHGLGVGVHGTLLSGASAVIVPRFTPDAVLNAAARHSATMFFGVPTMWVRMLESSRVAELAHLRLCVSGSAPLSAEVFEGLAARGGQRVVERYGMTETVMLASNPLKGERRPGSVGMALPGVSIRIDGPSPDGVGEIVVSGPNVFGGYWDRPEANAEAFTPDGWFRTGDLGAYDLDGYLRIVGRSKDLIITGGYNVYPRDVEDVLRSHPCVEDAAVVGEPSAEWGETVTAFVVLNAAISSDALMDHAAAVLAGYQRPRRLVLLDELPRNALGKVVKSQLPLS